VTWRGSANVDIEKFFFGGFDRSGPEGVEYFDNFTHPSAHETAFDVLLRYMSVQKLRTPKGLGWLAQWQRRGRYSSLMRMQEIQAIFCAIWTEAIWQIADANESPTKFIISDHPVTVYNRACPPLSKYCRGFNDPDIRLVASQTYFPLSLNKVLILTNLSWVRNPYQSEMNVRPNPNFFRGSMFKFTDIQTHRSLTENEVIQINYITKSRALRYIAGAEKEWLYPERYLQNVNWKGFGEGLLLMPEPRDIYMGGEIMIGYEDGSADGFSEYGHKPWEAGYKDERRFAMESKALRRFQGEWAKRFGPNFRGSSFQFHRTPPHHDSSDHHNHLLEIAKRFSRGKTIVPAGRKPRR
jgi:hypothetical protein